MPNIPGLGGFGAGDIVAYLGVGKTAEFKKSLEKAHKDVDETSRKMQTSLTAVAAVGAAMFVGSIAAAVQFESSFAGVLKTVDGLDDGMGGLTTQGEAMARAFRDLALTVPVSVNDLAKIGELGGQLGIAKEDLVSFTETIARLGTSTNMSVEMAATEMARFVNVTKLVAPEGMTAAQQIERIGSTIVALGNNFATTESEISAFAQRLSGAGSQIGLTQPEIMAFSASLSSLGVNAEAGGTAFSKLFADIAGAVSQGGVDLANFARVAGMSAQAFSDLFKQDSSEAITRFISGLGDISRKGGDTFKVLDDLGLSEMRLRDSLMKASSASDIFTKALGIADIAYTENNALVNESTKRYQTFESQLALLKNAFNEAFIEIGNRFLPTLSSMAKFLTENHNILVPIITALGSFVIALGAMAIIGKIVTLVQGFTTAINVLKVALLTNPITAILAGIALAVAALYTIWSGNLWGIQEKTAKALDFVVASFKAAWEFLKDIGSRFGELFGGMGELIKAALTFDVEGIKQSFTRITDAVSKGWGDSLDNVKKVFKDAMAGDGGVGDMAEKTAKEVKASNEIIAQSFNPIVTATGGTEKATKLYVGEVQKLEAGIRGVNKEIPLMTDEIGYNQIAIEDSSEATGKGSKEWADYLSYINDIIDRMPGLSQETKGMASLMVTAFTQIKEGALDPVSLGFSLLSFAISAFKNEKFIRSSEEIREELGSLDDKIKETNDLIEQIFPKVQSNLLQSYQEIQDMLMKEMETATGQRLEFIKKSLADLDRIMNEQLFIVKFDIDFQDALSGIDLLISERARLKSLYGESFDFSGFDQVMRDHIEHLKNLQKQLDPNSAAYKELATQIRNAELALQGIYTITVDFTDAVKDNTDALNANGAAASQVASRFMYDLREFFGEFYKFQNDGIALVEALEQAIYFGVNPQDAPLLERQIKKLIDDWLVYLATLDPNSQAFKDSSASLRILWDLYYNWLNPALADATTAQEWFNDVVGLELPDAVDAANEIVNKFAENLRNGTQDYYDAAGAAADYSKATRDAASDTYDFNETLEDQLYLINELTLAYENWLGYTFDQYDEYLSQLGRFDKEGIFDPSGPLFTALQRLLDFGISLDDTNVDEQIADWILQVEAFLATLDPNSDAYKALRDALDALIAKFIGMGGEIDGVNDKLTELLSKETLIGDLWNPKTGGMPDVTGFHTGGYVTAHSGMLNSGDEVWAKLQKGEVVLNRAVVNKIGTNEALRLNREGPRQSQQQQPTNINVIIKEPGPRTYAEITESVYPIIKDKQQNYEPGVNPYRS